MTLKSILASSAVLASLAVAGGASAYGSDYALTTSAGGLQPEGTYANLTNPYIFRTDGAWGSYVAPPTSTTGIFEVVNGAADPTARFFYETDSLTAFVPYTFAADIANNYPVSPPVIQLVVNGVNTGASQTLSALVTGNSFTPTNAPPLPGPFMIHDFTFTPTTSGSYTIGFVDLNTDAGGNDFSFDPMSSGLVSSAPEPASWALMTIGFFGLGGAVRSRRRSALAA